MATRRIRPVVPAGTTHAARRAKAHPGNPNLASPERPAGHLVHRVRPVAVPLVIRGVRPASRAVRLGPASRAVRLVPPEQANLAVPLAIRVARPIPVVPLVPGSRVVPQGSPGVPRVNPTAEVQLPPVTPGVPPTPTAAVPPEPDVVPPRRVPRAVWPVPLPPEPLEPPLVVRRAVAARTPCRPLGPKAAAAKASSPPRCCRRSTSTSTRYRAVSPSC